MNNNDDISLVTGGYIYKNGQKEKEIILSNNKREVFRFGLNEWKKKWYVKTLTVMYRLDASREYEQICARFKYTRDVHLFYYLLKWGAGIYIPQLYGVYNVHSGGICSSNSREKNAIIAYNCHKELYIIDGGEPLRYLLLGNINLRLRLGKKAGNQKELIKEGLSISTNVGERIKLVWNYIKGRLVIN